MPGTVSWHATTDNPLRGKSETSGSARDSMEFTPEWVISRQVAPEFGITSEDTIYVNGELYQESSLVTKKISEKTDFSEWVPDAVRDWIPDAVEKKKGSAVVAVFVLFILYLLFGRK